MSDIIHLLPDAIANQIAAGEVIQRAASCVKELMENAIDAGSTGVRVFIKDSGKTLIQVADNGCGMTSTDARISFERHATSKINTANDLFAIRTMGFRGEALASIASIAQVEMKTRRKEDEVGSRILIEGFKVIKQEPCQCPAGTSIAVKNLFFNVPARRNFLKSNTVEMRHIIDEFQRIAIANPDAFFSLNSNGHDIFHLKPSKLRQRIVSTLGNQYNERLVPVEEKTSIINITGYVGKPESARKSRGEQFFFVNKRFIKSAYLNHAIKTVYEDLIPEKYHPLYVLFINIDPSKIDVNVHPTKQEVKFEDEKIIYTFIHASVKHALAQHSITPTLDFDQDRTLTNLESFRGASHGKEKENDENFAADFQNRLRNRFAGENAMSGDTSNWEMLFDNIEVSVPETQSTLTLQSGVSGGEDLHDGNEEILEQEAMGFVPTQIHNMYIVSQIKSGFILVDQQSSHERVLYEHFIETMVKKNSISQRQLFPQTIMLSTSDTELLKELLPDINALGFDVQEFGKNTFVVHGVPADFPEVNEQEMIENLLEQFKMNLEGLKLEKHENLARTLARTYSIKRGKKLATEEMKFLIDQLFACKVPYIAPNGNLTFVTFSLENLADQFKKNA